MSDKDSKPSRRGFFVSASAAGAALASASLLKSPAPTPTVALPKAAPANGGGYSLSEHVKRYYHTARV